MSTLFFLVSIVQVNYLAATAIAVEAAVLHNFLWHAKWTWADRAAAGRSLWFRRLVFFHLANGVFSVVGNLLMMRILVGTLSMNYIPANIVSIAACAVLNFAAGDRFVFRASGKHT